MCKNPETKHQRAIFLKNFSQNSRLKSTFNMKYISGFLLTFFNCSLIAGCDSDMTGQTDNTPFDQLEKPPNIIWIMADDLGYGELGSYGQQDIRTPRLDQMAEEGLRFTQFYAGHTVSAPARSSLMTGQHTGNTPIRGNHSAVTGDRVPLEPHHTTVAEVLQESGYATGIMGKWGLGEAGTTGIPNRKGFDYFWGFLNQQRAHTYYPNWVWRDTNRVILTGNRDLLAYEGREPYPELRVYHDELECWTERQQAQYSHDLDFKEADKFIRANREGPFFLYLSLQIPHTKLQVPDDSLEEYLDEDGNSVFDEVPHSREDRAEYPFATYAAMISRMDRDVGRILDLLQNLEIDDHTLVFFTSDNGPASGGMADAEYFNSNGPLRGIKRDLYEGGIRVPMIVWMPGTVPAGQVSDQVWSMWDFMPTTAELARTEPPANIDGISMVNALLNRPQQDPEYLYWEFLHGDRSKQAVRFDDWKAVRNDTYEPTELYDLSVDIGENNDLADQYPEVVARAEELFHTARTENDHYPLQLPSK